MECFESVVVAGGQGGRFQPVCDKWNEYRVVYSELPLECEVCVAPELMKRVKVFAGLGKTCRDVFVCGGRHRHQSRTTAPHFTARCLSQQLALKPQEMRSFTLPHLTQHHHIHRWHASHYRAACQVPWSHPQQRRPEGRYHLHRLNHRRVGSGCTATGEIPVCCEGCAHVVHDHPMHHQKEVWGKWSPNPAKWFKATVPWLLPSR